MALVPFPNKAAKPAADDDPEPDWDDHPSDNEGGKMSFLEHLDELRRRIIYSLLGVVVGFVVALFYINEIFDFVLLPMAAMLPSKQLISIEPGEIFFLQIKTAVLVGLLLASPVVFSQVWLFIAPGLYSNEKKMAIPFIVMSTFFFVAGAAFAHYAVFPVVWRFFISLQSNYLAFTPQASLSFSLYLRLILACGVVFQLPTLVLFLARMGMITAGFMIRKFKYAVMIIVVASAILSPDGGGVGMAVMAGPVTLLYIFSIGLAWMFGKKRRKPEDHEDIS